MRSAYMLSLLLCLAVVGVRAQQSDKGQTALTVRSTLVEVPVLVKSTGGKLVFELMADDFLLTDNGVPQHLTLDQDTDSQPLALAIVVETGGAGARHLSDYRQLDSILDVLIGNVEHRIAIIGFDSVPHLLMPFAPRTADASQQLASLNEGDQGAAILDGIASAIAQLRVQPTRYRRAILLLSETIDQGSRQLSMKLCASSAIRIRRFTVSAFPVHAPQSPMRHQSLRAASQAPSTAASAAMEPIPSTKATTASRCSTASASLLRLFG